MAVTRQKVADRERPCIGNARLTRWEIRPAGRSDPLGDPTRTCSEAFRATVRLPAIGPALNSHSTRGGRPVRLYLVVVVVVVHRWVIDEVLMIMPTEDKRSSGPKLQSADTPRAAAGGGGAAAGSVPGEGGKECQPGVSPSGLAMDAAR